MKEVTAISIACVSALVATPAFAIDELGKYAWKSRVVLLFGGSGGQKLAEQVRLLKGRESDLASQDMVVLSVLGDEVCPVYGDGTGVDARKLRKEAGVKGNGFQAVPIGKDGGVKLRSSDVVDDKKIFGVIDQRYVGVGSVGQSLLDRRSRARDRMSGLICYPFKFEGKDAFVLNDQNSQFYLPYILRRSRNRPENHGSAGATFEDIRNV